MAKDGRQARWDKHNQQRRQQILDAALVVIEAGRPGDEFHVQQIAVRAGLNRTVVYRHFDDRADLDRAIRAHVLDDLTAVLIPTVSLDGTIRQIIRRIVGSYVEWVAAHPAAHTFAVQEISGPFEQGTDRIAGALVDVLRRALRLVDADLDDDERLLLDPLAHVLVGAVFGAVRHWVAQEPREPEAARLVGMLSLSVWSLIDGHARRIGLELDPDRPIGELFATEGATP